MYGSLSLYVHIPFCQSKCYYCSFNSYAGMDWLIPDYVRALVREIRCRGRGEEVGTVYFGGGTPSLLNGVQVGEVLAACASAFSMSSDAEISVEANPGTISSQYLAQLRELGVNRLSLGVQSFDDGALAVLGRGHSAAEAVESYSVARGLFENVNIDLLYAVPGQTLRQWRQALKKALSLRSDHLSLYSLSVEPGTPLHRSVAMGAVAIADVDLAADMYLLAEETLTRYEHYEISNWALPGKRCRHNMTYWMNQPYLGFGAGAHSHREHRRFRNVASPGQYVEMVSDTASAVEEVEDIDEALEMGETMMLGLRLAEGVSKRGFADRFGRDIASVYGEHIEELAGVGLVSDDGAWVRLTDKGRLLGNQVFLRFLP